MKKENRLSFASDYMEGAHPLILRRLEETNLVKSAGYGLDEFSESAREKIRAACHTPEAEVFFLAGGTQTNAVMIDALLRPWQFALRVLSAVPWKYARYDRLRDLSGHECPQKASFRLSRLKAPGRSRE